MKKLQKDLVKGDVIRVEYGDYDNYVTVVVDSVDVVNPGLWGCCLTVHYKGSDNLFNMYGDPEGFVQVI